MFLSRIQLFTRKIPAGTEKKKQGKTVTIVTNLDIVNVVQNHVQSQ